MDEVVLSGILLLTLAAGYDVLLLLAPFCKPLHCCMRMTVLVNVLRSADHERGSGRWNQGEERGGPGGEFADVLRHHESASR